MEVQFPRWLSQFLAQSKQGGEGGIFLQHEELQEQLRKLEHRILAKVSEDQQLSARDVGVALQMEGVTGVTPEVRICLPTVMSGIWDFYGDAVPMRSAVVYVSELLDRSFLLLLCTNRIDFCHVWLVSCLNR